MQRWLLPETKCLSKSRCDGTLVYVVVTNSTIMIRKADKPTPMPDQPVCLAQLTPTRYFTYTEQTITFCWDEAYLLLSPGEFVGLADFLTAACCQLQTPPMGLVCAAYGLLFDHAGAFQLWLFDVHVSMDAAEMDTLLDLVATALDQWCAHCPIRQMFELSGQEKSRRRIL